MRARRAPGLRDAAPPRVHRPPLAHKHASQREPAATIRLLNEVKQLGSIEPGCRTESIRRELRQAHRKLLLHPLPFSLTPPSIHHLRQGPQGACPFDFMPSLSYTNCFCTNLSMLLMHQATYKFLSKSIVLKYLHHYYFLTCQLMFMHFHFNVRRCRCYWNSFFFA